jgi:RNA polymerase sigma factor (TIGR02999 family)
MTVGFAPPGCRPRASVRPRHKDGIAIAGFWSRLGFRGRMLCDVANVTQILNAIGRDDPKAAAELLPLIYDELRKLAAVRIMDERPGQTLQATALVHEAYLRLVGEPDAHWNSRGHFIAAAAEAMRRILIENARRKKTEKRGGQHTRIDLSQAEPLDQADPDALLGLDELLPGRARPEFRLS